MSSFDEKSYIKNLQVYNDETRKLFNNKNKIKRERLVVKAFLRTLGISFDDIDLTAPTEEPVDVKYRTAHFQIRELLKKERKRGDELKHEYNKYNNVTSIDELLEPYSPSKPVSLAQLASFEIPNSLSKKASEYPKKYPRGCQDIDALVYVNIDDKYLSNFQLSEEDVKSLKYQNWRSVSILFPPYGVVLIAEAEAPDFLNIVKWQPQNRWDPDTLFE